MQMVQDAHVDDTGDTHVDDKGDTYVDDTSDTHIDDTSDGDTHVDVVYIMAHSLIPHWIRSFRW